MRKFTPEESEQIIRESRETISRVDLHTRGTRREDHQQHDDSPVDVDRLPPVEETLNQRHARELGERDMAWARERARKKREDDLEQQRQRQRAEAAADRLQATLNEVAAATVTVFEIFEREIAHLSAENRELKTKLAEVEIKLAELRLERADRKIDLPNPLSRVN